MWIILALLVSLCDGIYSLTAQYVKLTSMHFMVYRGLFVSLLLTPFLFFIPLMTAWQFYAIAVFQGFLVCFIDLRFFKANQKFGAETVSSITPVSVGTIFLAWCLIDPFIVLKYWETPLKSLLILASLGGLIFALMQYRKVHISQNAVVFLVPLIIGNTIIEVCNKSIMAYALSHPIALSCWRAFIVSLIIGIFYLMLYVKNNKPLSNLVAPKYLKQVVFFSLIPCSMILKNVAIFYADNPSYVSALAYVSLFWIMGFNRVSFIPFEKKRIDIEEKWVFLLLASVIVLILTTR